MIEFEKICQEKEPSMVVVVGDVNSTVACSIVCAKLTIPCAHVEAGLRSFDREMPEEINRILTDSVADLLLTPSPDGDENLITIGNQMSIPESLRLLEKVKRGKKKFRDFYRNTDTEFFKPKFVRKETEEILF